MVNGLNEFKPLSTRVAHRDKSQAGNAQKPVTRPQSYEKYKNLCSQACEYKSFWKTLVFTSFVKFNPIMPVFTCKYKLLKYNKLKNSFI